MNRIKFIRMKRKFNKFYLKTQRHEKYCFFCTTFIENPNLSYVDYYTLKVFKEIYYICVDCYKQMKNKKDVIEQIPFHKQCDNCGQKPILYYYKNIWLCAGCYEEKVIK